MNAFPGFYLLPHPFPPIEESMCVWALSHFSLVPLCDPMDCSPPGSSVRGILQARILEWVATPPGDLPNPGMYI